MGNVSFMERLLDGVVVEWKALGDVTEYSPTRIDAALLDETSLCTRQFFIPHESVLMTILPSTSVMALGGHKNSANHRSESEVWCSPCSKVSVK